MLHYKTDLNFPPLALLFALLSLAFNTGCGPGVHHENESAVSWPELQEFDEIAHRAEGLAETGQSDEVRAIRADILEAGRALSSSSIPPDVAHPKEVEQLMGDLDSLVEGIAGAGDDDEALSQLVVGLHPVVSELMEAAGMAHLHANEGPHEGTLYPVFGDDGEQVGTAEIKLHDDGGDIELWLTRGGHGGSPWLLPVDTKLLLDFPKLGKSAPLAVRDRQQNPDESGAPTIQDGATSYFVFPGNTDADATWLAGEDFAEQANLQFSGGVTGVITLRPHAHHSH